MHLITKYIRVILVLILPLMSCSAFGQTTRTKFNRDSSKTITLNEFNQRVDRGILLLKTRALSAISDTDQISMMMCYNTIFMTYAKGLKRNIAESNKKDTIDVFKLRFSGGQYDKLFNMMDSRLYFDQILKIYPKWIPNRGMGMFFPALQMEIGGTPMQYAIFTVTE